MCCMKGVAGLLPYMQHCAASIDLYPNLQITLIAMLALI